MNAKSNYPTDKLVIKYLLCDGAVGGLIMGALAMHNELHLADNLRGFAHVLGVGAVCGLLQDIFMYHNGTRDPFALQQTTAVAMLTCMGRALIVGAVALTRQPEKGELK